MTLAAIGSAVWRFLKGLPWQVWAIVLAVVTGYVIDRRARGQQRKEDQAAFDKEAAAVESEVISNINENTDAVIHESDVVREHTSARQLPNGGAGLEEYNYRDGPRDLEGSPVLNGQGDPDISR